MKEGLLGTRDIQRELLGTLIVLDDVFAEHEIRYSLDGGTLLGAVRHKGFIPWDDDIDVMVPRPDFERLCVHPEWFADGFKLAAPGLDGHELPFAKLFNLAWRAQEPLLEGVMDEYLWVDIFPADGMPDDPQARASLMRAQARDARKAGYSLISVDAAAAMSKNAAKRVLKRITLPLHRAVFPARKSYRRLAERASSENKNGLASTAGNVVWAPYKPDKPGFPVEDFDNLIDMEFEGRTFKACPHWDAYLTGLYGDYMQLPPVDQRVTHGMKVWKA